MGDQSGYFILGIHLAATGLVGRFQVLSNAFRAIFNKNFNFYCEKIIFTKTSPFNLNEFLYEKYACKNNTYFK